MNAKKIFWRTVKISSVIIFNIILLLYGICVAYKNTRLIAYGEYSKIINIEENTIEIFDYTIKMPDYLK
ncbi:MAG: hypothetical protein E7526_03335 [Ruminococcaceae bacterium]|nr:hypothetical protein [Oscillospiraceae bacterium]